MENLLKAAIQKKLYTTIFKAKELTLHELKEFIQKEIFVIWLVITVLN